MLSVKQKKFFDIIIKCYKEKKEIPTIKDLKNKSNFKSYNSIYEYLKILERKNYLSLDKNKKRIIYINSTITKDKLIKVPILNTKNYIDIPNDYQNKDYIAFQIKNKSLDKYFIRTNDILIIEKTKKYLNNQLVLVLIEDKYEIFKCNIIESYIKLENKYKVYVEINKDFIIGKVKYLIRTKIN